jgi:hypothetical protein
VTRLCANCEQTTATPVPVREIHGNSGPGWTVHTCPDCAPLYIGEKTAWRLVIEHGTDCPVCRNNGQCPMAEALLRIHQTTRRTPGPGSGIGEMISAVGTATTHLDRAHIDAVLSVPPEPGRDQ